MKLLNRLQTWKTLFDRQQSVYESLKGIAEIDPDSKLGRAIFDPFEEYTKLLSELIGDEDDWLYWYCWDNDMGKNRMGASANVNRWPLKPICNLSDLERLLNRSRKIKEEK